MSGAAQPKAGGGRGGGGRGRGAQPKQQRLQGLDTPVLLATKCKFCFQPPAPGKELKEVKVGCAAQVETQLIQMGSLQAGSRIAVPLQPWHPCLFMLPLRSCHLCLQFKDNGERVVACYDCLQKNEDQLIPLPRKAQQTTMVSTSAPAQGGCVKGACIPTNNCLDAIVALAAIKLEACRGRNALPTHTPTPLPFACRPGRCRTQRCSARRSMPSTASHGCRA